MRFLVAALVLFLSSMGTTKLCKKCGEEKPVEAFAKCSSAKDGKQGRCRVCQTALAKAWNEALFASYLGKCAYCPASATDFDHVQPLARGGCNCIGNLVPACEACNASKGAKTLLEFLMYRKGAGGVST